MARRGENIHKRKDGRWEGRYIKARTPDRRICWGYIYGTTFLKVINPQIGVEQDQDGQATQCDYLWIDVFPFDYLPETKSKETLREIAYQRKLLGYKIAQEKEFYKHKKGIKKVTYYILAEIFKFVSVDRINEKIISLSKSNAEKRSGELERSNHKSGYRKTEIKCGYMCCFGE